MTNVNNTENNGSKKKYLVPLIVLLLCGVAMTGAGYAYSSSVTDSGTVTNDYIMINLYSNKVVSDVDTKDAAISSLAAVNLDWKSATTAGTTTWTCDSETCKYWVAVDSDNSNKDSITVKTVTVGLFTNEACTNAYTGGAIAATLTGLAANDTLDEDGKMITITIASTTDATPSDAIDTLYMKILVESNDITA